jgi:N-acetylneuraminate synthase
MVRDIRSMQGVLGDGAKSPQPSEWDTRKAARQQVVAARDVDAGALLARDDLSTARCGAGLDSTDLWSLVGTRSARAYRAGDLIEP